jgi:hypothetical protein
MQRLISPSIAQISPSNPLSATGTWLTPDKSDNRTFEVALHLSGLRVNRDLSPLPLISPLSKVADMLVFSTNIASGAEAGRI